MIFENGHSYITHKHSGEVIFHEYHAATATAAAKVPVSPHNAVKQSSLTNTIFINSRDKCLLLKLMPQAIRSK